MNAARSNPRFAVEDKVVAGKSSTAKGGGGGSQAKLARRRGSNSAYNLASST
jgi:hypothetical protein